MGDSPDIAMMTVERLKQKSLEAFLLAVELYNRPSIKYHAEGSAFFICNAWELLLKSYFIEKDGLSSIYYRDAPNRTITLNECIRRLMTNERDPVRINLERVIDLRNTSTHFVLVEHEIIYGPLLQACVKNYEAKARELLGIEVSEVIPEDYLVLSVRRSDIDEDRMRAQYDPAVVERVLKTIAKVGESEDGNPDVASLYQMNLMAVRNPRDADVRFSVARDADIGVLRVKETRDFKAVYPYTAKKAVAEVRRALDREGIDVEHNGECKPFNMFHWGVMAKYYGLKTNETYCYDHSMDRRQHQYVYSRKAVDLVIDAIRRDPRHSIDGFIEHSKSRPQEQGNSKRP